MDVVLHRKVGYESCPVRHRYDPAGEDLLSMTSYIQYGALYYCISFDLLSFLLPNSIKLKSRCLSCVTRVGWTPELPIGIKYVSDLGAS